MTAKNQQPNFRSKIQSASFLVWVISAFYLLAMVWFLLSTTDRYGTQGPQSWLALAVAVFTVGYGILMLWLWPNEQAPTTKQMEQSAKF